MDKEKQIENDKLEQTITNFEIDNGGCWEDWELAEAKLKELENE